MTHTEPKHIAELGDAVLWSEGGEGSSEPVAAVVTALGMGSAVTLNVLAPNMHNMRIIDGVRHADDPDAKPEDRMSSGSWRFGPRILQLIELLAQFDTSDIKVVGSKAAS